MATTAAACLRLLPEDLRVVDYYSPFNFAKLTQYDLDIAAASVIWFPYHNHRLVAGGGKEGALYLLDADSLGSAGHQTPCCAIKNSPMTRWHSK